MIQVVIIGIIAGGLAQFLPERVARILLTGCLMYLLLAVQSAQGAQPPPAAQAYQRAVVRETRLTFGLDGPTALFGGQIEQESAWKPTVCSAFACGLAQFTPATAEWISQVYKAELGSGDVYNPEWAIRALLRYDAWLFGRLSAATPCDRWAFTLSAYNGGLGWVVRDRKLCAAAGCNPARWFGSVERFSERSPASIAENRRYPARILGVTQFSYAAWGPTVSCPRS